MSLSEADGRAAELRLQRYRLGLYYDKGLAAEDPKGDAPCNPENVAAMQWIASLADSGHWGAKLLLRRVAENSTFVSRLVRHEPEAAMALTKGSKWASRVAAVTEMNRAAPVWPRALAWMRNADSVVFAACIEDGLRICGTFDDNDLALIRATDGRMSGGADLLADLGQARVGSTDKAREAQARELYEVAAKRGSRRALAGMLNGEWFASPDRAKLAASWCDRYEPHVPAAEVRAALRVAAPLSAEELDLVKLALQAGVGESGALLREIAALRHKAGADPDAVATLIEARAELTGNDAMRELFRYIWKGATDKRKALAWWFERFNDSDMNQAETFRTGLWAEKAASDPEIGFRIAVLWYAAAKGTPVKPGDKLPPTLAYWVAVHLDPHVSFHWAAEPERARTWYERGVESGDPRAMDDWLRICAMGRLGIPADAGLALAKLRAFIANARRSDPFEGYSGGFGAIVAHANEILSGKKAPPDPAEARRWLMVAAEGRYQPAIDRLAALEGAKG